MSYKKKFLLFVIFFGSFCAIWIGSFWDIFWHLEIGERRLKYLLSFGKFNNFDNLHYAIKYYPGVYDVLSYFFLSLFPKKIIFELYNVFSLFVGVVGLIGIKKFCKIHFGNDIANLVFALTVITPIYFGQMIINPKDIVVSSSYFWFLYYVSKFFIKSRNKEIKIISFKLGLVIALGTGSKIVFCGLLIPVLLILIFEFFLKSKTNLKKLDLVKNFGIIFITTYITLIFFWPSVHSNILVEPFKILFQATARNDLFGVPWNLYANKITLSNNPSWDYIPLNLLFKTPIYLIILLFLSFLFIKRLNKFYRKKISNYYKKIFYICLLLLAPVMITIFLNLKIYDGLRNFLYILPLLNILVAPVIIYFFLNLKIVYSKIILLIIIPFFTYFFITFIKLTPYQYTYTNLLNKIVYNPYSFENDYFATSLKAALKEFSEKNTKKKFKIAACVNHQVLKHYLNKYNFKNYSIVSIYDNFDYAILINRPINSEHTCMSYFNYNNYKELINVERNNTKLIKIIY